jgi:hypothetical protein
MVKFVEKESENLMFHNSSFRRLFVVVLSLCILAVTFLACGESSNNTGTATNSSAPSNSSSGTTPTTAPAQHFKVGQQVKVGDTWLITVDSAKTSTGSEFNKPQKSGDVFLVVVISMKNVSSQEQNVSSALQWALQDSSGQKYDETIDTDAGATLDGKVEAGSLLKGSIAYEVPGSVHDFTLSFQNDITAAGETIWDIHV